MRSFALKRQRVVKTALLVICLGLSAILLTSCSFYSKDEDTSNALQLGETANVECQFNFLVFFERGPYSISITPLSMEYATVRDRDYDLLKIEYEVTAIKSDETSAEFATCTAAIDLLNSEFDDIGWEVWWVDNKGTEVNIQTDTLEIGKKYTFYIPLTSSIDNTGFRYIAVADRSGWWGRGTTYWYDMSRAF